MRKKYAERIDNKGFSLVELLIAVAIASIVGAAVFGFMRVGAQTFNFNSSDVNIQSESQLAFNQMQELIIDTAVGVQYFAKNGATLTEVGDDSEIGSSDDKLLRLNNTDYVYDIWWDRSESKLIYNEYEAIFDHTTGEVTPGTQKVDDDHGLMSEYITDFSADLSRLVSSRVVRVDFTYEKAGRVQSSSHNITLRNQVVSGNKVEEKLKDAFTVSENVVPDSVEGKTYIYVEPGETISLPNVVDDSVSPSLTGYHVYDTAGVEIPTSGADAKETLHYGFSTNTHRIGYTTIGYSSGSLHIDSKEDLGEITVRVYCQSNNSVGKDVYVRVVGTSSVSVNFIEGSGAADEIAGIWKGDNKYSDDLNVNETFSLKAVPNINYTESNTPASEVTAADKTKLQGIESSINSNMYFVGLVGYPTLFKENNGVAAGTRNINPLEFKMADTFNFDSGTETDYYTSNISVRAVCGHSEDIGRGNPNDNPSWTKIWDNGRAYKKKADFNIKDPTNSDVQRGKDYVTPLLTDGTEILGSNKFTCKKGDTSDFWTKHCELIEVTAKEFDYDNIVDGKPTERDMPTAEFVRSSNANGSEGANWTWKCPYEPYQGSGSNKVWNPNCEYEFRFTIHIAHAHGNDANKCFVLPRAGYTRSDYEYTSNTITMRFERLLITYRKKADYPNVFISSVPNSEQGNHVTYYARKFGEYYTSGTAKKNEGNGQYKENSVVLPMTYSDSFSYQDIAKKALVKDHDLPWKAYEPQINDDGISGWSECTSNKSIKAEGNKGANFEMNKQDYLFRYFKHLVEDNGQNDYVELDLYKENWSKDVPPRMRIYPLFKYNNDNIFEIKDSYIECVFWNVKVPHRGILGEIYKQTNWGNAYDALYFPAPDEPGFPGAISTPTIWEFAGYGDGSGYPVKTANEPDKNANDGEKYYNLRYTLTKNDNYGSASTWMLKLMYKNNESDDKTIDIASYTYNPAKKLWDFSSIQ